MTDLPESLKALNRQFIDAGFSENVEPSSDSFGNQVISFSRGKLHIRFVRDRGQWFLELSGPSRENWFDPDIWRSCIEEEGPPLEPRPLDEQAAFVSQKLLKLMEAARRAEQLKPCLEEQQAERAHKRLGIPRTE
jgi:hypothetical protein